MSLSIPPISPPAAPARVLLLEDDLLVAEYLASQLRRFGHLVVGHATHGAEALRLLASTAPHLLICDIKLAPTSRLDGIEVVEHLRRQEAAARPPHPPVAVLYLTAYSDGATTARAYATGPVGYLTKPYTDDQLRVAVALALHQAATFGATATTAAAAAVSDPPPAVPTPREHEVLRLLARGLSTKAMATRLHLSELTVQTHRRNLAQKYGVRNTPELMALAAQWGWLTDPVPAAGPGATVAAAVSARP